MHRNRLAPPPATLPLPSRRRALRRSRVIVTIAVAAGLVGASGAHATTIDYAAGTLALHGTAGPDDVLLTYGGGWSEDSATVEIKSWNGGGLTPAAAAVCSLGDEADQWVCPRPAKFVATFGAGDDDLAVYESTEVPFTVPIEADGGPGNDTLDGGSGYDTFYGGDGDDALTGRDGDDRIFGQGGNDTLNGDFGSSGPGGNDHLDGGDGDDQFEQYVGYGSPAGLQGNDTYVGGPGNDSFSYFHRANPVTITLDGIANDGMAGEADNVHPDLETVGGSAGNDVIVGSPGDDVLWSNDGDDVIRGMGGNDRLSGDNGNDLVDGGPGNDELTGGCMTDTLIGGPGADGFYSDAGPLSTCGFSLRSPTDRIEAADGERDALIFCQQTSDPAGDTAIVDAIDPVSNSGAGACATISVAGGAGGNPPVGNPPASKPGGGGTTTTTLAGKRRATLGKSLTLLTGSGKRGQAAKQLISLKRKRLTLGTLRATRTTKVKATATIRRRGRTVTLGRATVTVKAGATKRLDVKLTGKAVRALKGVRKASLTATFKVGKKTYRKSFRVPVTRA